MKAKHCTLGHVLGVLLVLCSSLFLGCTNENDLSGDQNDGTDPGRIATLEDQAASIEASIRDLEEVYEKHEELIEKLSTEVSGLEDLLDALESSGAYEDPTETQAYKELKERYSSLQNAKSLLSEKIDSLKVKDEDLDKQIAALQEYVDCELKSSEDWVESTFATLEKYNEIQGTIDGIKGDIAAINTAIANIEEKIATDIKAAIDALRTELGADYAAKIEAATSAYTAAIADIEAAYTKAIADAITKAEESMKEWVNETLADGYYDIATIDRKLEYLETKLSEADTTLAEDLADQIKAQQAALEAALEAAKEELTEAYEKVISAAIDKNNGVIDDKIAETIETAKNSLQGHIGTINSKIESLETKISAMEETVKDHDGRIKTVEEQITSITSSLSALQEMDITLESLIGQLEKRLSSLEDQLGSSSPSDPDDVIALQKEIIDLKGQISSLESKDKYLDEQIAALQNYVDGELESSENWVRSTFATLEQYYEVQDSLSSIKGNLKSIEVLVKKNEDDISAIKESIVAIEDAEKSMESWVNGELQKVYSDISALWIELEALAASAATDEELAAAVAAQQTALEQAKSELTAAYEAAIEEAIENNKGKISAEIIAVVSKDFETEKEEIYSRLDEIESKLEQRVDEILAMIQSVTYMPEYSDGAAYVGIFSRTLEMSFKLSPSSVVASLKKVWESSLSVKFLTTKSTKAAPVMKDLSIKSAEFDETIGTVTVTVDCSNLDQSFYTGETSASASLFIYDGHSNVSSDFVPLVLNEDETIDVPSLEAANCYIVSESGWYQFRSAKGNSLELLSDVESAEVLWESFGTDVTPEEGDLVSAALYRDGNIYFKTADTFKEGNAVIAAKDASGTILWSWHIWLTDHPKEQVYKNNAGTMMDRNLGATSATPGDVGALGLLYQWGRKDPFLGSSSISRNIEAKSTITWPSAVSSDSSNGTIAYVTANPTTFIWYNSNNYDWYYTGSSSTDNTRWTTFATTKSIYDPCPSGWRVPDGGHNGIWSKALGSLSSFEDPLLYDSTNEGINFSGKFGSASTIWYPASGYREYGAGGLGNVGHYGGSWSASPSSRYAYHLSFSYNGPVYPSSSYGYRAAGHSVRCIKEGTGGGSSDSGNSSILTSSAVSLTTTGTSNSYIVSQKGTYSFPTVKGNSSASVGSVESAEVLWESFGTDVTPEEGDLVSAALYRDGNIYFKTADTFKEGNAVIAAKDASGKILWSWHIWLTDQPEEQVYYNNAGTMMDRNLGATSATPGDVGALGLLYQRGRKDPFLGSSSISSDIEAKSTGTWPSAVSSNSTNGTIEYATAYPTTFIKCNISNYDWYYTGSSSTDNTRWTTSETAKSIYDPCPAGWRVPDGGSNGIWSKAGFDDTTYDSTNKGISFSISSPSTTWYPASGSRGQGSGGLGSVGTFGYYWSASHNSITAYYLNFSNAGSVSPSGHGGDAAGHSVRCIKEGTGGGSSDSGNSSISTSSAVSLTTTGTSNSYIVSQKGTYSFPTVKGNSSASVGSVESAEVLWESFGTDVTPEEGDLVSAALYRDGNIYFKTADTFKEGNAVIAAKDASGKILWSWHIWLTDQPQGQVYYNNAGTMMDRNLGATSATPGDVGALGLLYQWGRKDPFLGSSSISRNIEAKSTGTWPSAVSSNSTNGTIAYATANPTTFIGYNSYNYDWYYTGSSTNDNTRWTTSETAKSIYDPCPAGWRVPDGGNGIWSKALGSLSSFKDPLLYDSTNEGINFSGKFGSASTIWYPASGVRDYDVGGLYYVGYSGYYWSASPSGYCAYYLLFDNDGSVYPSEYYYRALGQSVRCLQVIDKVAGANAEE